MTWLDFLDRLRKQDSLPWDYRSSPSQFPHRSSSRPGWQGQTEGYCSPHRGGKATVGSTRIARPCQTSRRLGWSFRICRIGSSWRCIRNIPTWVFKTWLFMGRPRCWRAQRQSSVGRCWAISSGKWAVFLRVENPPWTCSWFGSGRSLVSARRRNRWYRCGWCSRWWARWNWLGIQRCSRCRSSWPCRLENIGIFRGWGSDCHADLSSPPPLISWKSHWLEASIAVTTIYWSHLAISQSSSLL